MEAQSLFGKIGTGRPGQLPSNRKTALLIALLCAVLAAALVYVFVSHRKTQTIVAPPATATVFVARHYIAAGTPETTVAADNLLEAKTVPVGQVIAGAITDPSEIAGQVVSAPLAAGQQVTVTEFSHNNVTLASYLTRGQRAVAISIDAAHGLESYLTRGDTVDVMTQGPSGSYVLFEDVTVLANRGGDVVLDLNQRNVLSLANALQHGLQIWLALRPTTGATNPVRAGFGEAS